MNEVYGFILYLVYALLTFQGSVGILSLKTELVHEETHDPAAFDRTGQYYSRKTRKAILR